MTHPLVLDLAKRDRDRIYYRLRKVRRDRKSMPNDYGLAQREVMLEDELAAHDRLLATMEDTP